MTIDEAAIIELKRSGYASVGHSEAMPGDPSLILVREREGEDEKGRLIDLIEYYDAPRRVKGTAQVVDASSFIAYVNRFKEGRTIVFGNEKGICAHLNYHTDAENPGWGDHRCTYLFQFTPEWDAWLGLAKRGFVDQDVFADFLDVHRNDIAEPDAGNILDFVRDLRVTSNVTFERLRRNVDGTVTLAYRDERKTSVGTQEIELPKDGFGIVVLLRVFKNGAAFTLSGKLFYRLVGSEGEKELKFSITFGADAQRVLDNAIDAEESVILTATGLRALHVGNASGLVG